MRGRSTAGGVLGGGSAGQGSTAEGGRVALADADHWGLGVCCCRCWPAAPTTFKALATHCVLGGGHLAGLDALPAAALQQLAVVVPATEGAPAIVRLRPCLTAPPPFSNFSSAAGSTSTSSSSTALCAAPLCPATCRPGGSGRTPTQTGWWATSRRSPPHWSACPRWTQVGTAAEGGRGPGAWMASRGRVEGAGARGGQLQGGMQACARCSSGVWPGSGHAGATQQGGWRLTGGGVALCCAGGFGPKLESWAFALDRDGLAAVSEDAVFQTRTCKLCKCARWC